VAAAVVWIQDGCGDPGGAAGERGDEREDILAAARSSGSGAARDGLDPTLVSARFVMEETPSAEPRDQFHRERKASDISRGKSNGQDDSSSWLSVLGS
jgi:hypothetical protein